MKQFSRAVISAGAVLFVALAASGCQTQSAISTHETEHGSQSLRKATFAKPLMSNKVAPKSKYDRLIAKYARQHGVPLKLAHAVITVESNYRANARGAAGEVGLMQIKPATARMMGYRGKTKSLYAPDNNLNYGMKYLGEAHRLGGGNTCGTILKYNAGHGATRMNKISAGYCKKIKRILARG